MPIINDTSVNKFTTDMANDIRKNKESQFVRFLDSTPTFCTIYNISNIESLVEFGSKDIDSYIGVNSPLKYNKIEDYPLYGFSNIENEIQFDEVEGSYNEFETTVKSIPSDLVINVGDSVVYPNLPDVLFTVSDIREINLTTEDYREITLSIVRSGDYISLIENQILDEYDTIYNNIGTEDKVVIRKEEYTFILNLQNKYTDIINLYLSKYYDTRYSNLLELRKDNDFAFIDPMLHLFLTKNGIITSDEVTGTILFFDDSKLYSDNEKGKYISSMYLKFENGLFKDDLESNNYTYFKYKENEFDLTSNRNTNQTINKINGYQDTGNYELIPLDVKNNIVGTPVTFIEKVLNHYLYQDFDLETLDQILSYDAIFSEMELDKNYHYFTIPLVLYIIRFGIRTVISKL